MNPFLVLFILLLPVLAFTQADSTWTDTSKQLLPDYTSVNIGYGRSFAGSTGPFGSYFSNTYDNDFWQESDVFSLNLTGPLMIGAGSGKWEEKFDAHFGFNYRRASMLNISDTVYYKMGIGDFHFALGYDLLYFWKNIDLPVRAGCNMGMAVLNNSGQWNRNPFFNFVLQVQPRIIIWKIALSAKAEISADISSQSWKPYGNTINDLMAYKNNYKMLMLSVGYTFK